MRGRYFGTFFFLIGMILACLSTLEAQQKTATLPLFFEENRGQAPAKYEYAAHREGLEIGFLPNEVDVVAAGSKKPARTVRLVLIGSDAVPVGKDQLKGRSNYFQGKDPSQWLRNIPDYREVEYAGLYPGVSLSFYGNGEELEHDFKVEPGGDPSRIAFRLEEAEKVTLSEAGDLDVQISGGTLILRRPIAYQQEQEGRSPVDAEFLLGDDGTVRFRLGTYDAALPLVIDPVFTFSTYLAGTGQDRATAVTSDASGNIYVTGGTASTDFPVFHAEQPALKCDAFSGCGENAFVTKLDSTGKTLIYSTYLGGSRDDYGFAIRVDGSGNAIVAGIAMSPDFPRAGAFQSSTCQTNDSCYFLTSLTADGSALNYSGVIGGEEGDYTNGFDGSLAVDTSGAAYLAGSTQDSGFPTTPGTLFPIIPGYPYSTMFLLKVDAAGKLIYSTGIVGNAPQDPSLVENNLFLPAGISVDAAGQVTVSGTGGPGLPTTPGVVAVSVPNSAESTAPTAGFVLQLNATASALNFSTYLPGTDTCHGLAIAKKGNLYLTGYTGETTFPATANAYQKTLTPSANGGGALSGYIMELNPLATAVVSATYLDGTQSNQFESSTLTGIALDSKGDVFVGGATGSPDFPLLDPFTTQLEIAGNAADALVVAELSSDLSTLLFGTFLSSDDGGLTGAVFSSLAIDSGDHLIVVGTTSATDYPTTAGSFEPIPPPPPDPYSIPSHSFVSKIDLSIAAASVCLNTQNISFGQVAENNPASTSFQVTNCGNAPLNFASLSSSSPTVVASQTCGAIAAGAVCAVTLTYTPVDLTAVSGTLMLADNAAVSPQVLTYSGQGVTPVAYANLSTVFLNFGTLAEGSKSTAQLIYVQNNGNAPLKIAGIVSTNGFVSTNDCGTELAAGSTCQISVTFAPASTGAITGTVTITDNASGSPQTITLTGTGVAPVLIDAPGGGTATATVASGGTATYNLSLAAVSGFSGTVSLSCNGAPIYATCIVSPSTATLAQSGSTNLIVTVRTSATTSATVGTTSRSLLASSGLLSLLTLMAFFIRRKHLRFTGGFLCLIGIVMAVSLSGCSGSGPNAQPKILNTPAGTYTLSVVAIASGVSVTTNLTLVVQ